MSGLTASRTYQELRWGDDMDPNAAETESDLESLEQDVLHILQEHLGTNLADPNKGAGVADFLNGTTAQLAALPATIDAQLANVDRLSGSKTTLSQQDDGSFFLDVEVIVGGQIALFPYQLGPGGLTRR
jgi:phage baseplate assembly protein W